MTIEPGQDGFYHPASEDELVALVKRAHDSGVQLRVRGSMHSVRQAIFATGFDGDGNPPPGPIEVMLDKYIGVEITPDPNAPGYATVVVQGGCHLGRDPYDPTKTSTWETSLNYQLQQKGYSLGDLGGITHQTVSGFLMTGSSGGSLMHSIGENLVGFRFIDGTGTVHDCSANATDPAERELFEAVGVSMGLLGVISTVTFRAGPTFNIFGKQVTSAVSDAFFHMYGANPDDKPSFEDFLRETPYTRIMWWPQLGFERVQAWQASRAEATPDFTPQPYEELGKAPRIAALAGSLVYTIVGNLDDVSAVPDKLQDWYAHLEGDLEGSPDVNACVAPAYRADDPDKVRIGDVLDYIAKGIGGGPVASGKLEHIERLAARLADLDGDPATELRGLPDGVAKLIVWVLEIFLREVFDSKLAQLAADALNLALPYIMDDVLGLFVSDGTQNFWDTWMCGLPMDNQMDDQLWPTAFTELWIPIEKSAAVLQALYDHYHADGNHEAAYEATGAFSCEIYGTGSSPFWMSPSYGKDVIRIDVFWFELNAGDPRDFYDAFWEILKPFGFRPHWGKYFPMGGDWPAYYSEQLPKMKAFLDKRAELDPKQIFVSDYWREALGITKPSC